jgi:Cu+-exporting ATPase
MTADDRMYTCPMHPEIRQRGPGNCPKCGMTLEPVVASGPRTEWTCPMHPEIVRDTPGSCPICGMALEPRTVGDTVEGADAELADMTRRFGIGLVLTLPLLAFVMGDMLPGQPLRHLISSRVSAWLQLVLATPVVLWAGWSFFERGWASIVNRSLNMFTLIALGTGMAYVYSVVGTLAPQWFPASFRTHGDEVGLYFEAAAVITVLVLLGQVLELRARSQTSSAIRALLRLAPSTARRLPPDGTEEDVPLEHVQSATAYAYGPVRRFPWTAWCSKAEARWTSRW